MKTPVVGGLFGLEDPLGVGEPPPWHGREQSTLLTVNARGAIRWLADHVQAQTVWLPSYLCHTMVDWIRDRDARVRYYPVDSKLKPSIDPMIDGVKAGDLLITVAYFGRRTDGGIANAARARGAVILEDASQAWFTSGLGESADWLLYSPRKYIGVADGGVLISLQGEDLATVELPPPPSLWWHKLFAATVGRHCFDAIGDIDGPRDWFRWMQEADIEAPFETCAMSELTRRRLEQGLPAADYAAQRRANHDRLQAALADYSLLGELAEGEVPLGFVTTFPDAATRDRVREKLLAAAIYPMIHWPIAGLVPETFTESHELNARILTLVCDHRYGEQAMDRTIAIVREVVDAA